MLDSTQRSLSQQLRERQFTWLRMRASKAKRTRQAFLRFLSERGYVGELRFDHDEEKLHIEVHPNQQNENSSLQSLSGGERSYSTVALMMALWDVMEFPFAAMDEFDVFMDSVHRRLSIKLLTDVGANHLDRQFVFLSPQTIK